jgi:hypothetical protein
MPEETSCDRMTRAALPSCVMKKKWVLSLGVVALMSVTALAGARALFHADGTPQYAWLVFGSEGKLRVQIRLKGEAVSLEQFVDGKSTGRKDHFRNGSECANFTIADPDGKTSYVITSMSNTAAQPGMPAELFVDVDVKGQLEYRQYCDLQELKEDPQKAPLAHFHGPLTAGPVTISWKIPPKLALQRGDKPTNLPAYVGTMNAEKGCWVVVRSERARNESAFPKGVHPFVDVEFPAKQAGASPIKRRYPLDQAC